VTTVSGLLDQTSRTFALGIRQLPGTLRDSVGVAYLLLRVADYLEDNEVMQPATKIRLLRQWAAVLQDQEDVRAFLAALVDMDDALPDVQAARHADEIWNAFQALPEEDRGLLTTHVAASSLGMARWVERGPRFDTEADLDDYMFEVAGRVGHLLTDLFSLRSPSVRRRKPELMELGREFGLGLQTVNVIRGLSSDPHRGWLFIPADFVPGARSPGELVRVPPSDDAMVVLRRLADKAAGHLDAAVRYVEAVPRRQWGIRVFCMLPLFFAVRTLALSRHNPDVFTGEVKLSRPEVRAIALRTRLLAPSNRWLRGYAARLAGPDGRSSA